MILRFYDSGSEKKKVLAEFTIGLKAATVTPSHSYEEGGALDLSSATRYEILQNGGRGQEQNGFTLLNVSFSNFQGVRSSSLIFELPEDSVESALGVEVYGSGDTLLWKSDSMEEDGTWNENWYFTGTRSCLGKRMVPTLGRNSSPIHSECPLPKGGSSHWDCGNGENHRSGYG